MRSLYTGAVLALLPLTAFAAETSEFCLDGEFNLGARLQHHRIADGWVPTTWCVTTDDDTDRVLFSATGKSNPDMEGDWTVAYFPPETVRIVNRESPPDVEFQGTNNADEGSSVRRLDPRRLFEEHENGPIDGIRLWTSDDRVNFAIMEAIFPVQGVIDLTWSWNWEDPDHPRLIISGEKELVQFFRGTGTWRAISKDEAQALWSVTPGEDKIEVPGDRWPARSNMQLINLTDDVYMVRGVRTGFQHMVIDTENGLIVADAPASWLELHQLPPKRFLPELRIDGLSENLIQFLNKEFEDKPIHAVALTHFHDDHVGGAPAFAAVGADVYATPETAESLATAFSNRRVPESEAEQDRPATYLKSVDEIVTLGDDRNRVELVPMGSNPHVFEMLGVWAVDRDYFFVSDVHVPHDEGDAPGAHRAKTECWFASWAVDNLPTEVRVVNSHSTVATPVSRLAKYLESDLCR